MRDELQEEVGECGAEHVGGGGEVGVGDRGRCLQIHCLALCMSRRPWVGELQS